MRLFETKRIVIRDVETTDAEMLLDDRNSGFVNKYNLYPHVSIEEFKSELTEIDTLIIQEKTLNIPIGCVYVKDDPFRYNTGSFEIAGWLKEDFAHHGYASEVLPALIKYMFCIKRANRLAAHVFKSNVASHVLMTKFGFNKEGHLEEAICLSDGAFVDVTIYSIGRADYIKSSNNL